MDREFTKNLEEFVTFGLDSVDSNETVKVNLKDLLYVYNTLAEYMRFFHQPLHYQSMKDIEDFLGSVNDNAGFKILHKSLYEKMREMIPIHISDMFGEGDFDSPKLPHYYNENR